MIKTAKDYLRFYGLKKGDRINLSKEIYREGNPFSVTDNSLISCNIVGDETIVLSIYEIGQSSYEKCGLQFKDVRCKQITCRYCPLQHICNKMVQSSLTLSSIFNNLLVSEDRGIKKIIDERLEEYVLEGMLIDRCKTISVNPLDENDEDEVYSHEKEEI